MAAGARPAVLEVPAAGEDDRAGRDQDRRRPEQAAAPAAGNARADGGEHRQRGQNGEDKQGRASRPTWLAVAKAGGGGSTCRRGTTASRWSAGTTSRRRSRARPRGSSRATTRLAVTCRPTATSPAVPEAVAPRPRSGKPHTPAADSRATSPPRTTSSVRPGACGRSSMSDTSSSANSSPYRSRHVLGYQRQQPLLPVWRHRRRGSTLRRRRPRARARSPGGPVDRETAQADVGHPALRVQVRLERDRADGRELVRAPAVVRLERLDHSL